MRVHKFEITTWTSSFRYPNYISGFQPSLEVPPLSTVLGFINAAAGRYLEYKNDKIAYYFEYGAKGIDVETIYQIDKISSTNLSPSLKATSNVIRREFLYDCHMYLYILNDQIKDFLINPIYPLLLGRSSDLAQIKYLGLYDLESINNANKIKGQIIPFNGNYLPGIIQPLPQYFTNSRIRKNIGTQPYSIINYQSKDCETILVGYKDITEDKEIHIYFHELYFSSYYE